MSRFATGVTVVTAAHDGEARGMTANAFMSGSLDPRRWLSYMLEHPSARRVLLDNAGDQL